MKISIITAVYNGARDIEMTLRSVADQDYDSIEHIVVDGASTDSTLDVVRSNDRRVACVISERDDGVYDAFNKGLRATTGDAIGYLNCGDTYVSNEVVSKLAKELSSAGTNAVFGDLLIVDAADRTRIIRRYSSKDFSPARMAYGFMPAHPTLFLRREIYDNIGEYDTRFRIAGDFELCLRAFANRATKYRYLSEPLVCMARGGLSNRGWRSKWDITREMKLACAQDGVDTSWLKLCLRFPLKMLELF